MAVISLKLKSKSRSVLAGNAPIVPVADYLVIAGGAGGGTFEGVGARC